MRTVLALSAAAFAGAVTGVGVVLVCFSLGVLVTQSVTVVVGATVGLLTSLGVVASRIALSRRAI